MISKKVLCGLMSVSLLVGCASKSEQKPSTGNTDGQVVEQKDLEQEQLKQKQEMSKNKFRAIAQFNEFASKNAVYFAFDSDKVNSDAILNKYEDKINQLNNFDDIVLTANGYCDNRGSVEYNNILGMKRANAVKNVIAKITDKDVRINTISFGKNKYKIYTNDLKKNYQENRKVEIVASTIPDVNE